MRTLIASILAASTLLAPTANADTPTLTQGEIAAAETVLGNSDPALAAALREVPQPYRISGPRDRTIPLPGAIIIATTGQCLEEGETLEHCTSPETRAALAQSGTESEFATAMQEYLAMRRQ